MLQGVLYAIMPATFSDGFGWRDVAGACKWGQRLQGSTLDGSQQISGRTACFRMNPLVGHVAQPFAYLDVGGIHVQHQSHLFESARQRYVKIASQITVEAFHLALGLRPVRSAQPGQEAVVLGQIEQLRMPAVVAVAVGITLDDDGARVVIQ